MATYSTLLKTWGDTGSEFPDGYAYLEGEQPVDAWDNFTKYNTIEDIEHLVSLTNKRIESDKGVAGNEPTDPEASHLYHDTDNEALSFWDGTAGMWHRLIAADGDTLEGALDFSEFAAQNVGSLTMSGTADLRSNDLVDGTTTVWDAVNGYVPQLSLENDSVTVTVDSQFTGGGTVALGESLSISLNQGAGSGLDADTLDGFQASELGLDIEEDGSPLVSGSTAIDFTGHLDVVDDGDGTVTIDPTHNHDGRYYTKSQTRSWVNNNADVPNADYADSAGNADTVDGWHKSDIQDAIFDGFTFREEDGESTFISSGETITIAGGGGINSEYVGSNTIQLRHNDTSTQGNLNTGGGTIIDYVNTDGYGHVTNMGTRSLDGRYLQRSGGGMTGDIDMNNRDVTEVRHIQFSNSETYDLINRSLGWDNSEGGGTSSGGFIYKDNSGNDHHLVSSHGRDYSIDKNGNDGNNIINFKT